MHAANRHLYMVSGVCGIRWISGAICSQCSPYTLTVKMAECWEAPGLQISCRKRVQIPLAVLEAVLLSDFETFWIAQQFTFDPACKHTQIFLLEEYCLLSESRQRADESGEDGPAAVCLCSCLSDTQKRSTKRREPQSPRKPRWWNQTDVVSPLTLDETVGSFSEDRGTLGLLTTHLLLVPRKAQRCSDIH